MSERGKKAGGNQLSEEHWKGIPSLINSIYVDEVKKGEGENYWHYTSVNGVLGIFDEYIKGVYNSMDGAAKRVKECSVYASNIRFMNDSKEYEEGNELFCKLCNGTSGECKEKLLASQNVKNDNIYLISFCGKGDLLSQWKWYGKDSGVSLRFNLESTKYQTFSYVTKDGKEVGEDTVLYDDMTKPIAVRYDEKEKTKLFKELLRNRSIVSASAYHLVKPVFVPFCKDEGFSEEKESRLVFYYADLKPYGSSFPKFNFVYNKSEAGRVKPALDVKFSLKDNMKDNIVSEMIVGPGINQEAVFNLLIHLFDREYYSYQTSLGKTVKEISYENFMNTKDHQVHRVKFSQPEKGSDDKAIVREAYLCDNGIIIEKSSLPFRG